jgi:hypothetical protein
MSLVSATAAQRATLSGTLETAGKWTNQFRENALAPTADREAELAPYLNASVDALAAVGYTSTPAGAVVANGATVPVRNSAGADSHNATAVVSGTSLTGVNLAATVALVDNGDTVTATGTGTTATFVVTNGVVTGVTLS